MNLDAVKAVLDLHPNDALKILMVCGGFYECPKTKDGKWAGPVVGYAGKYGDKKDKQYVGRIYANFAKAEQYPIVLLHFAKQLSQELQHLNIDVFCGVPMGGNAFGQMLALVCETKYVYLEKKIIEVASKDSREKSELEFNRHEIQSGDRVAIVEDVTNNFSSTEKTVQKIIEKGGQPVAIISLLNRSVDSVKDFQYGALFIPVISLVTKPIDQYEQDNPEVVEDIKAGNVCWKPKDKGEWVKLMTAMLT